MSATASNEPARRILVICGPTATGKSLLALRLATWLGGSVINADSMQVYDALPTVTAHPDAAARATVPHLLYGSVPLPEVCSAARWRQMAEAACTEASRAGRLPILVGGTGLYLRALVEGLASIPDIPASVRNDALARFKALGGSAFRAALARHDPETASRLAPADRQRLVRAWEVWSHTGTPLSAWQTGDADTNATDSGLGAEFLHIIVLPERAILYTACEHRFDRMMQAGALDEVAQLLARAPPGDHPIRKALGVPNLTAHLQGQLSLALAVQQAKTATRQYAKRQTTWLRHQVLSHAATGPYRHRLVVPFLVTESLCHSLAASVRARLAIGSD